MLNKFIYSFFLLFISIEYHSVYIKCHDHPNSSIYEQDSILTRKISIRKYCPYYNPNIVLVCTIYQVQPVDIEELFAELENEIGHEVFFQEFTWTISIKDGILPSNAFRSFSFNQADISATNLQKINVNAFVKSPIQYLYLNQPNKVQNYHGTEFDLYQAVGQINKLSLVQLSLYTNYVHDIPDKAFENNKLGNFQDLIFSGNYEILRVGNYLIYNLPGSFRSLKFSVNKINSISSNAFRINPCSNCNAVSEQITIDLAGNQLTDDSLEPGAFDMGDRMVKLLLGQNLITLLREEVFKQFLLNNEKNTIDLTGNSLDCSMDKKVIYQWLLTNLEFKNMVKGGVCADGIPIWDLEWVYPNSTTQTTKASTSGSTDSSTISSTQESDHKSTTTHPLTKCNSNGEYNGQHNITHWPPVDPGQYSVAICPNGKGIVKWLCRENGKFDEKGPIFDECWLGDLLDRDVENIEDVVEILEELSDNLLDESSLHFITSLGKVEQIVKKLDKFLQNIKIEPKIAENITQSFVNVFSRSIAQTNAWNNGTGSEQLNTASLILFLIQKTSFTTNCYLSSENNTKEFVSNNLYEKLFYGFNYGIHFEYNSSSITLPKLTSSRDMHDLESCVGDSALGAVINGLNNYLSEELRRNERINSEIIAFSLKNTDETHHLRDGKKVRIVLKHRELIELGDSIECRYWDFEKHKWSSKGCHYSMKESNRYTTVCECNHLTNFAAIMDLSGREGHDFTKEVVTDLFCSLSVISLVITILMITKKNLVLKALKKLKFNLKAAKYQRKNVNTEDLLNKRDQIVLNQSVCLIVSNIIIMFAMDRRITTNEVVCGLVSYLLLYFLLSTFVWMLLHAIHLFRMTHNVFDVAIRGVVFYIIAYVVPLVISLFGLLCVWLDRGIFKDALIGSDYFCWISSPKHPQNIWILIGPALIIILVNIGIVGYLIHSVAKLKRKTNIRQMTGFLCLVLNLGLTWTLFLFYMHRVGATPLVFSYLFIVVNGSQGVFIFAYQLAIITSNHLAK